MTSSNNMTSILKNFISSNEFLPMPCCFDALSAKLIEQAGFKLTFILSIVLISWVTPSKAKNSVCNGTTNEFEDTKAITVSKLNDGGQSIRM